MATFALGPYRIAFDIEPLGDEFAEAERHLAWLLSLQLNARPGLRQARLPAAEIRALIDELRRLLELWPARRLADATPRQLGVVVLEVIEVVLMPCLDVEPMPQAVAEAVQRFCRELSAQLARTYRLPACHVETQVDLRAAWDLGRGG